MGEKKGWRKRKDNTDLHAQIRDDCQDILIFVKSWVQNIAYNILSFVFFK